jgi:hypothetical protein
MKRLSTKDILQGLISDPYAKRYFLGVFPRDKVPRITKYPSSLIVNTDKQGERGEHWLAIYVDKYKNCEFFDSFGLSEKITVSMATLERFQEIIQVINFRCKI